MAKNKNSSLDIGAGLFGNPIDKKPNTIETNSSINENNIQKSEHKPEVPTSESIVTHSALNSQTQVIYQPQTMQNQQSEYTPNIQPNLQHNQQPNQTLQQPYQYMPIQNPNYIPDFIPRSVGRPKAEGVFQHVNIKLKKENYNKARLKGGQFGGMTAYINYLIEKDIL